MRTDDRAAPTRAFSQRAFAIWRQASAELVTELGYDPDDILDSHGDGRLERDLLGNVVLHIVQRDADGNARINRQGTGVITRTKPVRITRERARAYRARTTLDAAVAAIAQEEAMATTHRLDEARRQRDRAVAELLGLDPDQTADLDVERHTDQSRPSIAATMRVDHDEPPEPQPERVTWVHVGDAPWPEHSHEHIESGMHPVLGWDRQHLRPDTWAAIIEADDEYRAAFTTEESR